MSRVIKQQYKMEAFAMLAFLTHKLLPSVIVLALAIGGNFFLKKFLRVILNKAKGGELDLTIKNLAVGTSTVLIYIVAGLIILDIFGVNTSGLLAMVGACGLAIGLALKDTLSNIAAGLMLVILHPFKVGDYVECGPVAGTINLIGLFTTKLTTADGVYIEAPNSALWGNATKNYSRNSLRRIDIPVGVSYGDSVLEAIRVLLAVAEKDARTMSSEEKPTAFVSKLDSSSVNLVLRVWVDKSVYWDVLHDLSRDVKLALDEANITIPFPQCDVNIKNNP